MMQRVLIGVITFLLINLSGFAQKGSIEGIIIDEKQHSEIPYATVTVTNATNGDIITGTVSDTDGKFKVPNIKPGTYQIAVSFIGYQNKTIESVNINKLTPNVNLGNVTLSTSEIQLEGVEVKAMSKTASTKIDKKTYRAADFHTAKGGNAVDLLNKLPSVSVDPDGMVSVRGTNDFMVYLNGKPTQLDPSMLLGQISGGAIENVEIITVPTAKYDAQGKGGIINITTKRSGMDGLSISANGLLGGAPWGNLTDKYSNYDLNDDRYGGGANLVYIKDRLSLYGSFNYNKKNVNGDRTGDARLLQDDGSYYHMVAAGERPEWYEYYTASTGLEYTFENNSTLAASYFYGNRTEGRSAFYVYRNFYADVNKQPIDGIDYNEDYIYNPNTDNRYGKFHTANIDYSKQFGNNAILNISALYEHSNLSRELHNLNYKYTKANDQLGAVENHYAQTDETPLDGFRLAIDYTKTFDNESELSFGVQPQFFNIEGGFSYDTLNVASNKWGDVASLENAVDLKRGVHAGYIDYSGKIGKLKYIAGLRAEYTDQSMEIENPDYFNIFERETKSRYTSNKLQLFPTLHLNYKVSDNDQVTLAGSRRISRPPIKNMAPFLYRRHYEVYVVGDPLLEPEYMNNVELSWDKNIGKQNITLTGFYRGVDNAVFRVNTVFEEENVLIRSYTNSGNSDAFGAELNTNLVLNSFTKLFLGGSLYNYKIKGDVFGYQEDNSSTNWSLKGNLNMNLTKALTFNTDFNLKSATVTAQGKNDTFYALNTAFDYSPEKLKNWNFSFRVLDILHSNVQGLDTRAYNTSGQQIFYQATEYNRYGPIVELGASFTLNMKNKKKKDTKTFGNEQF
ncbi:TonB-dependent receptor [Puteibacter caeruleilacunae]|nr:TonB-dependent receptor [Puteibacter caeruleilacunae]